MQIATYGDANKKAPQLIVLTTHVYGVSRAGMYVFAGGDRKKGGARVATRRFPS